MRGVVVLLFAIAAGATIVGCGGAADRPSLSDVFTPARNTTAAAVRDFFNVRPIPEQQFPFPHKRHIEKKLKCTDYCHENVDKGPIAGLPSVKICMNCHESIAADKPLIKTVADYQKRDVKFKEVTVDWWRAHPEIEAASSELIKILTTKE